MYIIINIRLLNSRKFQINTLIIIEEHMYLIYKIIKMFVEKPNPNFNLYQNNTTIMYVVLNKIVLFRFKPFFFFPYTPLCGYLVYSNNTTRTKSG